MKSAHALKNYLFYSIDVVLNDTQLIIHDFITYIRNLHKKIPIYDNDSNKQNKHMKIMNNYIFEPYCTFDGVRRAILAVLEHVLSLSVNIIH